MDIQISHPFQFPTVSLNELQADILPIKHPRQSDLSDEFISFTPRILNPLRKGGYVQDITRIGDNAILITTDTIISYGNILKMNMTEGFVIHGMIEMNRQPTGG